MNRQNISETSNKIEITADIVRLALEGAAMINDYELREQYGGNIPPEFIESIRLIQNNYEQFRQLVWKRLEQLPLTKKYFGRLIRARLKQEKGILLSPIVSTIFDDFQTLEDRLNNIQSVIGVESLRVEYRESNNYLQGDIADRRMRDLLAEVLTLDFLVKLDFTDIEKVSRKDKPHADIAAKKGRQSYTIDATRKQETIGWELRSSTNLEDCDDEDNLSMIKELIQQVLDKKDDQFCRAIEAGTISKSMVKVVALKTSDYGFAECIEQAAIKAYELLLDKHKWQHIDCIWLMPTVNVAESKWIYRESV